MRPPEVIATSTRTQVAAYEHLGGCGIELQLKGVPGEVATVTQADHI